MEEYSVLVRNEMTGETRTVLVTSFSSQDAQVLALTQVFRQHGWRKVCAFEATSVALEPQPA